MIKPQNDILYNYNSEEVCSLAEKICVNLNVILSEELGRGKDGIVFDIGENKVLKITSDISEHIFCSKFKEQKFKHITTFYKSGTVDIGGYFYYYIVKDKVFETDKAENVLIKMDSKWEDLLLSSKSLTDFLKEYLKSKEKILLKDKRSIKKFIGHLWPVECSLLDIIQELKSLGIQDFDISYKNFGFINNKLMLFDLGRTKF